MSVKPCLETRIVLGKISYDQVNKSWIIMYVFYYIAQLYVLSIFCLVHWHLLPFLAFSFLHFKPCDVHKQTTSIRANQTYLVKVHIFWEGQKISKIFPLLLTVCTVVKSKGKTSQNFEAFSEYMNFRTAMSLLLINGTPSANFGSKLLQRLCYSCSID